MKKLLAILLFSSCTHHVYVASDVIVTTHGLQSVSEPYKVIPNDTTIYTIIQQASAWGKTKN